MLMPTIVLSILVFFVSGSSLTNTLPSLIMTVAICIYAFIKHKQSRFFLLFILFVLISGFIISTIAPGNQVRQEFSQKTDPIKAILLSFLNSFKWLVKWSINPCNIALWIFLIPIIYKMANQSKLSFKFPQLFIVCAFSIFASQWTPPLYAMGGISGGRQINVFFFTYYWLMLMILFYTLGYLSRKNKLRILYKIYEFIESKIIVSLLVFILVMLIGARGQGILSLTTFKSIISGKIQQYDIEMDNMINQLDIEHKDIVYVDKVLTIPSYLEGTGLSTNPNYWVNRGYAMYFDHDAVSLK